MLLPIAARAQIDIKRPPTPSPVTEKKTPAPVTAACSGDFDKTMEQLLAEMQGGAQNQKVPSNEVQATKQDLESKLKTLGGKATPPPAFNDQISAVKKSLDDQKATSAQEQSSLLKMKLLMAQMQNTIKTHLQCTKGSDTKSIDEQIAKQQAQLQLIQGKASANAQFAQASAQIAAAMAALGKAGSPDSMSAQKDAALLKEQQTLAGELGKSAAAQKDQQAAAQQLIAEMTAPPATREVEVADNAIDAALENCPSGVRYFVT